MSRILLADDHAVLRELIADYMASNLPEIDIAQAADYSEVWHILNQHRAPDLVVMDYRMPGQSGMDGLKAILDHFPGIRIAILSGAISGAELEVARSLGIAGYIPKSFGARTLLRSISTILQDGSYFPPIATSIATALHHTDSPAESHYILRHPALTKRQGEVLQCLLLGHSNKEIARVLGISDSTVKDHMSEILRILGVRNRTDAVVAAVKWSMYRQG